MKHVEDSLTGETTEKSMAESAPALAQLASRESGKRGRAAKLYEYKGEMLTLAQLVERYGSAYGIAVDTLCLRLDYGWDMELALTEPADYISTTKDPESEPKREVEIAVISAPILEQRLKLADDVDSIKPELVDEVPALVKLIRERCQRLDEIDYEISLLWEERRLLIAKLEGK